MHSTNRFWVSTTCQAPFQMLKIQAINRTMFWGPWIMFQWGADSQIHDTISGHLWRKMKQVGGWHGWSELLQAGAQGGMLWMKGGCEPWEAWGGEQVQRPWGKNELAMPGQQKGQDGRRSKEKTDRDNLSQKGHQGPDGGEPRGPQHDDEF